MTSLLPLNSTQLERARRMRAVATARRGPRRRQFLLSFPPISTWRCVTWTGSMQQHLPSGAQSSTGTVERAPAAGRGLALSSDIQSSSLLAFNQQASAT